MDTQMVNVHQSNNLTTATSLSDKLIYNEMKKNLHHFHFKEFPIEWEISILNLLSWEYRKKYHLLTKLILREIKDMYNKDMQDVMNKIVLANPSIGENDFSGTTCLNFSYVNQEKAYNRSTFLKYRKLLLKRYFLSVEPIRVIINEAQVKLRIIICNFEQYHHFGLMSLADFQNIIINDIKNASATITNQFYIGIAKTISVSKVLKDIIPNKLTYIMRCITHVFVQQITNVMIKSIDHMLKFLSDGYHCPQIKFKLVLQNGCLLLSPSIEETYAVYHNIIERISIIAQDLIPLEEWLNIKTHVKYINIKLPDWYIKESSSKLQIILDNLFNSLNKYIANINEEFYPVCSLCLKKEILSLTTGQVDFDLYLKNIQHYNTYLVKINGMVLNTYYRVGKLEQCEAIKGLKMQSCNVINTFLNTLIKYHQKLNLSICSEFEALKSKALNIPRNPTSLIELCDYISHIGQKLTKELGEKIQKSIFMITALSEITVLTEDHIQLNVKTINWLHEIEPIFKQSNVLAEAMKNELEDDMQKRISNLHAEVDNIVPQLSVLDNMDDISNIEEYIEYYKCLLKQVTQINYEMQTINEEENLFKFPETEFPNVTDLHEIITSFYNLIYIIYQWKKDNSAWLNGPFEWLDASVIETKTLDYFQRITDMSKIFKIKIKMDVSASKCFKFAGIADDPDPLQQPAPLKLCWQALNDINDFKKYLPLVKCMCNPALQKRHWREMSAIYNFDLTPNAGTSLRKLIALNLMDDIEKYDAISVAANRELELEQKLFNIIKEWDNISFKISFDKNSGQNVFSNLNDIELLIDDHLIKIEEMKTSNFVKEIISTITHFSTTLTRIQEIIDQWYYIQMLLYSLNATFCYPSIGVHLSEESTLYDEIKKVVQNIESKLSQSFSVIEISDSKIMKSLDNTVVKLEHINQKVTNYIETKKLSFPRFCFLSDKEVQEILFESYKLNKLHFLIQKCFQGIEKIRINKEKCICSIIGDCGEEVRLQKYIPFTLQYDHEEEWLIHLADEINTVIKKNILLCNETFRDTFVGNTIPDFPSMIIVCALQLYWTAEVHNCFTSINSQILNTLYYKYIQHLSNLSNQLKNYSTKGHRDLLMTLIIIVIHQKDIIRLLLDKSVTMSTDFEWVAQLRYYREDNDVKISLFQATVKYGYEYSYYRQGIVNTPLTNRCYHTLMQAHTYHYYGAVSGPPATGKSETVKSLTKAIAIQFRVFNCAAISSYNMLSQILRGFLSCETWLCFENFDKLGIDLIARITQALISIFQSIVTNSKIIIFEGSSVKVCPVGHICVITELGLHTYSALPDNLKGLFRSVSMLVPDMTKIVEVELFAAGISDSQLLAMKLITFYRMLSQQLCCDSCKSFNLYSVKAMIKTIVYLKRSFPEENESALLLRSLIDVNISKLCEVDVHIFKIMVQDMFPGVLLLPPNYATFLETFETVCNNRSIYVHDVLKLKTIQLFELMHIYQSLIVVGDPFVGKTEILNILQAVLLSLYEQGIEFGANLDFETIVPGVIDTDHLFGHFDERCKIWKDGICSKILHSFSKTDFLSKRWIVFDGPLNNVWIEHLYTIFGTNNILQLTSVEKIRIANSVSIIFETMNLATVSPAIASNCGIIYIESNSIDWRSYMKTYFSKHNIYNEHKKIVYILFDWAIDPCLQFVKKYCSVTLDIGQLHYVMSTLNLFHMYLEDIMTENSEEKGKMNNLLIWIQIVVLLAIIWGIGGNLDSSSHIKFNAFCISLWNGTNKEYSKPEIIKSIDVTLPHEGLIQDNFYIFKGIGNWKYWGSIDVLKKEQILEVPDCNEVFVPTIDTMKYNYLFQKHVKYKTPFILCGDVSVGKTYLLKNFLKNRLSQEISFNCFSSLFLSSVLKTQQMLLSKSNKIKKRDYGSLKGQLCIHFIDDLNVSRYENRTEINSVLELFRQYHSYGYLYDTDEPEKVFIHNIMFLFSITETTITDICPRFLRHFQLYTMYTPATETIYRIFSNALFSNLRKNSFTADVLNSVTSISKATVDIYNSILKTLRPIPTKFQYKFSMTDISKVINGCSLLQKESVEAKVTFLRLWAHEIWRVFGDRIIDNNDKEWLFQNVKEISGCHFKDSFEIAFDYLPKSDDNEITKDSFNNLLFSNFMDSQNGNSKKYEEVHSIKKLQNKIHFYLNECNNNNFRKRIDLVVTEYVLECLIKISRILAIPGGHLLVISSIGSGRKTLASLAAYMQQQELFEPPIYSNYDFKMWRRDLKTILQKCGGQKQNLTLLIKHKQGKDDFLSDIICLLVRNEIPDLFSAKEICTIIQTVRLLAQGGNKNSEINNHAIMSYFLEQCKNRLHIILCFNTTNKVVRLYLNKYPELVKYCTVNWYEMWPTNMLMQIAAKYTQDINIEEDMKMNVIKSCLMLHSNIQEQSFKYYRDTGHKIHITLSAFLHMMKLYSHLMPQVQKNILIMTDKYLVGLQKLELTATQVEQMRGTLTILKPQLESSVQKTVTTMEEVENENVTIEKATILVQQEEEIANKKAEVAVRLKLECETDLAVAIPFLEDVIAALNTLKPTDITLVKAMKNPPDTVKLVMAAICVMLDVPPDRGIDSVSGKKYVDYWIPSKRILSDMNFLQILKDYDKDSIAPNIIQVIEKTYMTDNNFKPHIVAKASSAAEGLCKWVYAMVSYNKIAKAVAPKKEKLIIAQKECNEVEAFLNKKRKTLSVLNAKLAGLKSNLQETLHQKLKLEKDVRNCTNKLHKAENLMASLGGEKDCWMQFAEGLNKSYDNLAGDMILTCGIISYLGSYNAIFRSQIIDYWKQCIRDLKIPYSEAYKIENVLGEESDINYWCISGLQNNKFLIENALIMKNSKLWSLFIDSQNQANEWIKVVEKKNNLKVIRLTDVDHIATIRYNVEKGIPTLIENVSEDLELLLNPFLLKNIYNDDKYSYLDTGTEIIKYSFDFRLYMTTRLNNPQFSCEIFSKLTIINFSIPNEAIQDRLLDLIISKENPQLQDKLETLLMEDTNNKNILKKQESIILNILSSSTTNILEDEYTLKSLDSAKSLSLDIIKKQDSVKIMLLEMRKFQCIYIHFVQYCVHLFDISTALSHLNHMYCFSFAWLMQLYRRSIETSNRSTILEKRLKYLKSSFTQILHASICRSLSEKHKILYSFLMCCKILLDDQQTTEDEIEYFMTINLNHFNKTKNYMFNWLPHCIWINIYNLSKTFPIFSQLADHFCCNEKAWEQYYNSESLQDHLMPDPWNNKLSLFQKLILTRILCLDRTIIQITQMTEKILENAQTYCPQLKLSESYAESNCLTPLLFILPSSLEPLSLISAYAKIKGCLSKFISLSMSKGQEEIAELLIQKAQREGSWVFIQNCHLVPHWMIQLEKICENNSSNVSLNFRLWLSSCSMKEFPISMLQNSIKIIHDYPLNVKDRLLNIYQSTSIANKDLFEDSLGENKTLLTLVFGICLFHTVIQERMNFGVQGWHIPYKFDHNDLQISVMQLQHFINKTNDIPFNTVLYLIGECNYGGKVEDELNSRCLKYLLNDYCNPNIIAYPKGTCLNVIEELFPQTCEYSTIIQYIKEMRSDLSPEVFGSNRNAINIRNTVAAEEFLSSLLYIYSPTSVMDKELCQDELLCLIHDIDNKLCNSIKINETQEKCTSMLGEPLQRILFCEIKSLEQVLETVCKTLNKLKLALNGSIPYTDSLKEFAENIYKHRIPYVWAMAQGYIVTSDLSLNIDNLLKRAAFINNWFNEGNPKIFWLDALFHCKMLFATISLIFSKKYNIPVEKITLDFEITTNETIDTKDADTYLICGLHLCGARWDLDKNMLIKNLTNETWQKMPPLCVKYSQNKGNADDVYECPIYIAPASRDAKLSTDNYIFSIPLKSNIPQAYWIKCGVALFCHVLQ